MDPKTKLMTPEELDAYDREQAELFRLEAADELPEPEQCSACGANHRREPCEHCDDFGTSGEAADCGGQWCQFDPCGRCDYHD
jgi:hypothetical protein